MSRSAPAPDLEAVFRALRDRLASHVSPTLVVKIDTPTRFCLQGGLHPTHRTPMPVAWVQIAKAYVSYHLMPVYGAPQLMKGSSAELKAHMQGKACFNFRRIDDALFAELDALTKRGFEAFRKGGFIK